MAKKVRIGFIGCGGISHGHYQRLLATKKAQIVALNDPNPDKLKIFYERCPGSEGLPTYEDYRDMLKNEQLDAVLILSPHTVHFEQSTTSLRKGLHVLSEKPMVCTIQHAKALIQTARKAKRVLSLSYQRHYDPQFRYMRDQIAKGVLGKIQFVQAIQSQEWLRATKGTWRQEMVWSGGGQLNDSGSHLIDIVMWVSGLKVAEVFSKNDFFGTEVDINNTLAMKFENGALGSMSVIGNAPTWYEDHSIVGEKGAFYLRQGLGLIQQDATGKPVEVKLPKYTKNPDSNFIDCILGNDVPQAPAECGLRTIEVTEAAWKSAETGAPVKVPKSKI
ncbi:MAG TPA: Gfo/Idh/MocA family oxidoreductase [Candidatus Hydrogenedentes bacterium]|nr:Gfo/Idh/MocA family oxidoreductase [Candidatus Hydrogenedentota bacterium]HPG68756.1 Gfo/Idh/MocA family oxidoreductase [Candidatus Hydrogenedentota bacterium]